MPTAPSSALPLNTIRAGARIHMASRGLSASNLYLHDAIYHAGEVIQPRRAAITIPRDSVIVFADDEPLKNWGHRCRYLLHDPQTGAVTEEIPALLPPTLDFGSTFKPFHMPTGFSSASLGKYPILMLPPGLYLEAAPWHAILYSGASMNRHLNDLEFLYRTLVNYYGVPAGNITVLNYDGTLDYNDASWQRVPTPVGNWPGDNTPYQIKINGAGTKQALLDAISAVGKVLGPNDNLLLHTNNHGNTVNGTSTLIAYSGDDTAPSELAGAIKALPKFNALMVMMEQCFSGGFIQPIIQASPAACTSVATAVDANTSSDGGPEFDPFALAWITAMADANPDGSELASNPDSDASGAVSAAEAFSYAKANDTGPDDDPQYAQNSPCGGATTLRTHRRYIPIPPIWRYLWPWQILPDPGPEQVGQLAVRLGQALRSPAFRTSLATAIRQERSPVLDAVRGALARPGAPGH